MSFYNYNDWIKNIIYWILIVINGIFSKYSIGNSYNQITFSLEMSAFQSNFYFLKYHWRLDSNF